MEVRIPKFQIHSHKLHTGCIHVSTQISEFPLNLGTENGDEILIHDNREAGYHKIVWWRSVLRLHNSLDKFQTVPRHDKFLQQLALILFYKPI